MQAAIAPPAIPVGKIKSFGPFGPKYEVGHALRQLGDGDWMIEVTMVETGERTEYRWTHLREAEMPNIPFMAALTGALLRCSSLVWLATRRSERLALHPASTPKNGTLAISAPLSDDPEAY